MALSRGRVEGANLGALTFSLWPPAVSPAG